ncbi:hypothetical protein GCM10022262_34020 [Georgenia daeguensis]|uniref:Uncharacterized protein n=1 Tax=Georgenia daeguensis TaxID=908355 RepID=A0ABP8EYG9_9MICO
MDLSTAQIAKRTKDPNAPRGQTVGAAHLDDGLCLRVSEMANKPSPPGDRLPHRALQEPHSFLPASHS